MVDIVKNRCSSSVSGSICSNSNNNNNINNNDNKNNNNNNTNYNDNNNYNNNNNFPLLGYCAQAWYFGVVEFNISKCIYSIEFV